MFTTAQANAVRRWTRKTVSLVTLTALLAVFAGCGERAPRGIPQLCLPQGLSYICPDALVIPGLSTPTGRERVTVLEYHGGTTLTQEVGDPPLPSTDSLALHSPATCFLLISSQEDKIDEVDEIC
jgi:hypothetical protein